MEVPTIDSVSTPLTLLQKKRKKSIRNKGKQVLDKLLHLFLRRSSKKDKTCSMSSNEKLGGQEIQL